METGTKLKYYDLVYFGYDWDDKSEKHKQNQTDFINEIKKIFPHVELKDAYDNIKGFRQEVFLNESDDDNYYSWLIGNGWFECSFSMQMKMMSGDFKEKINNYITLAKKQYPDSFKPEPA